MVSHENDRSTPWRAGGGLAYRMGLAERVLDGEAGGPVDERERRQALRVLHLGAVPHVLVPVLHMHAYRRILHILV